MLNLNEREEKILKAWREEKIVSRLKERNKGRKKFYFLDGPPNAYGLATHHMWVYTIKDLVTKYKRFAGYDVHDRGGFDVHGLPIENRIERQMNLASKSEIESKVGVAAFVKVCKDYVDKEMAESVELLKRSCASGDAHLLRWKRASWGRCARWPDWRATARAQGLR